MKNSTYLIGCLLLFSACSAEIKTISPKKEAITSSVYASGIIESKNQYSVYPFVNGIIENVYVTEGDLVNQDAPLFSLFNETQQINRENAELTAQFQAAEENKSKINDLKLAIQLAKNKMKVDSANYMRQKVLFEKNINASVEVEQSLLAFENSKTSYQSAKYRLDELQKQIRLNDQQAKNNLRLSSHLEKDFIVKSDIKGKVYSVLKNKGEMVSVQTPIAIVGAANEFLLRMQIDEYDITNVKVGQKVSVTLDSYRNKTFDALVTKINPLMNERSKTFEVEAVFVNPPAVLYPNLSLEANIIIAQKTDALTIPRAYFLNGGFVMLKDGTKKKVTIGLKDYSKVEILSGLTVNDQLILPNE